MTEPKQPYTTPELRELGTLEVQRDEAKVLFDKRSELDDQFAVLRMLLCCANDGCGQNWCEECKATYELFGLVAKTRQEALDEAFKAVNRLSVEGAAAHDAVDRAANAIAKLRKADR